LKSSWTISIICFFNWNQVEPIVLPSNWSEVGATFRRRLPACRPKSCRPKSCRPKSGRPKSYRPKSCQLSKCRPSVLAHPTHSGCSYLVTMVPLGTVCWG
jgi:hypothetical protein